MATTLTKLPTVRRVLRGTSGPQPLAGTPQRAADAYAAMCAAAWAESADGPAIPAHDYKPAAPAPGDAYRQTWGYDADARTERSACGAVCYTVRVPADALTGTSCNIESVSMSLLGDRYLECGALVTVLPSSSPVPPSLAEIVADGDTFGPILVPDTTIERVNDRHDTSANPAWVPQEALAATAYIHILLRVADYLATRGSWHEGGASLDPAAIVVSFSRDVAADARPFHEPMYSYPQYAATVGGQAGSDNNIAVARYSTCGAILAVLEFPTRWWWNGTAGSAIEPGAQWGTTARAMRELVEDIRAPLQSYHNTPTATVTPGMASEVWGGNLQRSASGWPVSGVVQDARGRDLYGLHVGYQAMRVDGDATSQQKVLGLGCVVGVPVRRAGTYAPATGLRNWHNIAMGLHVSVEVAVYIAPRPPAYWVDEGLAIPGDDGVSTIYPTVTCATPSPYAIRPADVWGGTATSINMYNYANRAADDGPGQPYAPLSMRYLMRFEVDGDVPAGRVFPFPAPVADDDATILIFVRPTTFLRSGTPPDSTQDCFVSWPFDGWQLTLG